MLSRFVQDAVDHQTIHRRLQRNDFLFPDLVLSFILISLQN
jgi:hypothetical protein